MVSGACAALVDARPGPAGLAGDQGGDLVQPRTVTGRGVDLGRGDAEGEPGELAELPHEGVAAGGGRVGVRQPRAAGLVPAGDPVEGRPGVGRAVHDHQPGQRQQRGQPRPPHVVLERRLGHRRHPGPDQQPEDAEEHRQRPPVQFVARLRGEPGGGLRHPFLDLVPADGRAADDAGELVGERGLTRAGRPADDDQYWRRRHHAPARAP
ncbi:MAG TPA: hypothetical protein VHV09_25955 [Trebonia sp.]|nr:hypothetical protein [Trebonia sp.]